MLWEAGEVIGGFAVVDSSVLCSIRGAINFPVVEVVLAFTF